MLRTLLAAWFCLLWPFFGLTYLLRSLTQGKTFYFNEAKDAVLAIRARGTTWQLSDHLASTIGAGQGRHLRETITPALFETANRHGITITVLAENLKLAGIYGEQAPGHVSIQVLPTGKVQLTKTPENKP